jgi:hypothetical protein
MTATETLLNCVEGDELNLESQHYDWASAFEVADIDEVRWRCPDGSIWRSRELSLESTAPQGGTVTFTAVDGDGVGRHPKYGDLVAAEPASQQEPTATDNGKPDWLERPAPEIIDTSRINRSLEDVLSEVEQQDDILSIHRRLCAPAITVTKDLLWELGLRGADERLLPEDELQDRIRKLRDTYT